jgi:hypothetical protein
LVYNEIKSFAFHAPIIAPAFLSGEIVYLYSNFNISQKRNSNTVYLTCKNARKRNNAIGRYFVPAKVASDNAFKVQLHLLRPYAGLDADVLIETSYDLLAKAGVREANEQNIIDRFLHENNDGTLS